MRSPLGTLLNKAPVPYVGRGNGLNLSIPLLSRGGAADQMAAMGSVGTLFAIVSSLSNGVSRVPWTLYRKAPSGLKEDRKPVTRHAAIDLWNQPNPFMTGQEFREVAQQHLDLTGEAWWVISRSPMASIPLELWPVRPDRMDPVPSKRDFLAGYVYHGPDGEDIPLQLNEVIFLRMPNPLDPYRGMGPVQTVLTSLEGANATDEYNRNFFANSAEPGGLLKVDRRLDDDEFDQLSLRWAEQHRGVSRAHRVAILEGGLEWVERSYSQKDMQFVELRNMSRELVREAFAYPKPMLGSVDDVNRANAEAGEVVYGRWLLTPRLDRFKGAVNCDLLPLFAGGDTLEFDFENPVPPDLEAQNKERDSKVAAFVALVASGVDPAAALEYLELPDMAMVAAEGDAISLLSPVEMADLIAKLNGVAPGVLSWSESRVILEGAGVPLDESTPEPEQPALPAAPTEEATAPAEPEEEEQAAPALPPGRRSNPAPGDLIRGAIFAAEEEAAPREEWEDRLDELVAAWAAVTAAQIDELTGQVETVVTEGAPAGLATLTATPTEGAALLEEAMITQAESGAQHVADEAAEQGVKIQPAPIEEGLAADLSAGAAVTAAFLAAGLAASAGREALRVWAPGMSATDVGKQVRTHLEGLSDATLRSELGGQLWAGENEGRFATLELAESKGKKPSAIVADETRDANTCDACRDVDGRRFDTLTEAQAAYPFGGYRDCAGRARCRGTLNVVWKG